MTTSVEPCCDLKRPGGTPKGQTPNICWKHQSEGWVIIRNGFGLTADHVRAQLCGCVYTTLNQIQLVKCDLHAIGPMACCTKAKRNPCVCMYSYTCPDHHDTHIGTHD